MDAGFKINIFFGLFFLDLYMCRFYLFVIFFGVIDCLSYMYIVFNIFDGFFYKLKYVN